MGEVLLVEFPIAWSTATFEGPCRNLDHRCEMGHKPALEEKDAHDNQGTDPVVKTPGERLGANRKHGTWSPGSDENLEWRRVILVPAELDG